MEIEEQWMQKALSDLAHAQLSLEHGVHDWAQLAAQQAAEKALKAICLRKGLGLVKTHDLTVLARRVAAPLAIVKEAGLLNMFYTASRYPDVPAPLDAATTHEAISAAEVVVKWSRKQLTSP